MDCRYSSLRSSSAERPSVPESADFSFRPAWPISPLSCAVSDFSRLRLTLLVVETSSAAYHGFFVAVETSRTLASYPGTQIVEVSVVSTAPGIKKDSIMIGGPRFRA